MGNNVLYPLYMYKVYKYSSYSHTTEFSAIPHALELTVFLRWHILVIDKLPHIFVKLDDLQYLLTGILLLTCPDQ